MSIYTLKGKQDILEIHEEFITITPFGLLGAINKGAKGTKSIPLQSISAIQVKKPGFTVGYIQFSILGGSESRTGVLDAVKDENTVVFEGKKNYETAEQIKIYLNNRLIELRKSKESNTPKLSLADEIEKLSKLKDSGAITEEEFQTMKQKLISS